MCQWATYLTHENTTLQISNLLYVSSLFQNNRVYSKCWRDLIFSSLSANHIHQIELPFVMYHQSILQFYWKFYFIYLHPSFDYVGSGKHQMEPTAPSLMEFDLVCADNISLAFIMWVWSFSDQIFFSVPYMCISFVGRVHLLIVPCACTYGLFTHLSCLMRELD
jgi:hypothetical protein